MDASAAAKALDELYPLVYSAFYRRRDPRAFHPGPEALAILEHLLAAGPLTVQEAARHFDRSQSAMSERLQRLIERGLIERLADERDRRRHLHWLARAGEELVKSERAILDRSRLARVFERVPERQRIALVQGLRALLDAVPGDARQRGEHDER
jgi:DNA-binding MarR family transcriptional regulator